MISIIHNPMTARRYIISESRPRKLQPWKMHTYTKKCARITI